MCNSETVTCSPAETFTGPTNQERTVSLQPMKARCTHAAESDRGVSNEAASSQEERQINWEFCRTSESHYLSDQLTHGKSLLEKEKRVVRSSEGHI